MRSPLAFSIFVLVAVGSGNLAGSEEPAPPVNKEYHVSVNGDDAHDGSAARPWHTHGEGPTGVVTGEPTELRNKPFTARDIRFTTKGNALYAICLAWPGKALTIKSLGSQAAANPLETADVYMLGVRRKLTWFRDNDGLTIRLPARRPCEHAYAFRVVFKE